MMNKLLSLLLVLALALTLVACNTTPASSQPAAPDATTGKYKPGAYEGTAKGYAGDLMVTDTRGENHIVKILVA